MLSGLLGRVEFSQRELNDLSLLRVMQSTLETAENLCLGSSMAILGNSVQSIQSFCV